MTEPTGTPDAGARAGRDCYCGDLDEASLRRRGIPPGFCGTCQTCGAPGHTRHHPGAVPSTGAWCDRCYRRLALLHPMTRIGCLVWLLFVAIAATVVVTLTRG